MLWPSLAGRDWAPTSWQGMARMNCFFAKMIKQQNHSISDSTHPQIWEKNSKHSIFDAFFMWHCVRPQHMSRQRIHFGFPTLKIPQVLGFELGQKTHIFFMGFYGIITGKLWVFTGSGKTWFWEILWVLWEDYGFFMGKLWVFTQNPLFPAIIRQKTHKFRFQIPWL